MFTRREGNGTILQVHLKKGQRRRTVAFLLAVACVMPVGVQVFGITATPVGATPVASKNATTIDNGYDYTLRVNDVRLIPDATPGDGSCATLASYGATCTLFAAAEEANALSIAEPHAKVLVTLAASTSAGSLRQRDGSFANEGTILLENTDANTPAGFDGMIRGAGAMNSIVGGAVDGDSGGSVLWFSGNVVVDLQHRLGIAPPRDGGMSGAVISFTGQDQVLRNFPSLYGSEGAIYVGKTAKNLLIENGTIANGAANAGGLAVAAERAINVVAGSVATQVRGLTIDSMWRAGITLMPQAGNPTEAIHGLSVLDSTFSWNNRQVANAAYGIGTWGGKATKVNDLVIAGATFKDFRRGTIADNNVPISGDSMQFGGNSRISGNTFMNTIGSDLIFDTVNNDIRLTGAIAAESTVTIERNVFSNTTDWSPKGPAVLVSGGVVGGGRVAVKDNAFYGWNRNVTGEVISVSSFGGPPVALDRNTFSNVGGYTKTVTNSAEMPGNTDNPVFLNSVEDGLHAAYPSEATVIPGACQVAVTAHRPQAGGAQPKYPIRVDAFAGGDNGADVYLGGVLVSSEADWGVSGVNLNFPFSLGDAKLRLQTVDALGSTSPLSRTIDVAGADACGPQLWIQQAVTQEDPSWSRFLQYEVMSSEPLADGAIESALNFGASSAAGEIVSVQAASEDSSANTRWRVTVRADASGTMVLGAAAQSVQDRSGVSNLLPANASDAPNNVAPSPDPTGVAETPGDVLDASVSYRMPVSLSAPLNRAISATEGATEGAVSNESFTVGLDARDSLDRTMLAPSSAVVVQPKWGNLVPDTRLPDPQSSPELQASLIPNNITMSESDATIDPASRGAQIFVAAVDNRVVDGTRTVTLSPTLVSDDPEYNGLALDGLTITAVDDDEPAVDKSSLVVESNNALANGIAANRVKVTVRNAAGEAVQNAAVHFSLPAELIPLESEVPGQDLTSVTAITDERGQVTVTVGSTVAGDDFEVAATVDVGGREAVISGSPVTLSYIPGGASAEHSLLTVAPGVLKVGGEPHEVSVRVADAFGNYVAGQSVTFSTDPKVAISKNGVAVSGPDGIARVTLSSELVQRVNVSAAVESAQVAGSPATVMFGAPPTAPRVDPSNGTRVSGWANPAATVTVHTEGGALLATTKADRSGRFSTALSQTVAHQEKLKVQAADENGFGSAYTDLVIDLLAPGAPKVEPSNGFKLNICAEPHSSIVVRDQHGQAISGVLSEEKDGCVVFAPDSRLTEADGVQVYAGDPAGNWSEAFAPVIKTTPPVAPKVEPSNGMAITGGSLEEADSLQFLNGRGTRLRGVMAIDESGQFTFTPSPRAVTGDEVVMRVSDLVGNTVEVPVPILSAPPVPPVVSEFTRRGISGYAAPGSTVTATDDLGALLGTAITGPDGRFKITFLVGPTRNKLVTLLVTDELGNRSQELRVRLGGASILIEHPMIANDGTQVVHGFGYVPGERVSAQMDDSGSAWATATVAANGNVTLNLKLDSRVGLGKHTILLAGEKAGLRSDMFTVTQNGTGSLASTGSDAPSAMLSALALLLGAAAMVYGRRRALAKHRM